MSTKYTSVIANRLTDGSYTYDVKLPLGGDYVRFACDSQAHANELAQALERCVSIDSDLQPRSYAGLLAALRGLQEQLHAAIKLDVKKHYSLMIADAAASTAIARAEDKS